MELRLYSFVNFYLASIQQGIQTGHCAVDLVRKYGTGKYRQRHAQWVADWADHHKTFIILNGGDLDGSNKTLAIVQGADVPYQQFHESEGALGGMMTCVACVLPESIFNARQAPMDGTPVVYLYTAENGGLTYYNPGDPYFDLIALLRSSRLAS
jgi:hypothetical protein